MSEKTVLVIEDNPLNMKLVKQLITIAQHRAIEAFNAEDGIRLAQTKKPDLILLDVQLPGMDGLTAAGIIKNDPLLSSIPIIALTAHAMRGYELKTKEAGCDDYITKPIDTKVFFKKLELHLNCGRQEKEGGALANKTPQGAHTILVVDDEPLNVKLLAVKLGAAGYRVLKAYGGQEALNVIESDSPDLVLLDIMMPGMDGYEVIRRLRNKTGNKRHSHCSHYRLGR